MKPAFRIAALGEADLPELAETHVRTWQETYVGHMPQDYLDAMSIGARFENWKEWFKAGQDRQESTVLIARSEGHLAGFLSYGPARDGDATEKTEIYSINIRKAFWHAGIGYALFKQACQTIKAVGENTTYLWVLDTNDNALKAYQRWGGKVEERSKEIHIGGITLHEKRVQFDIGQMAA